MSWLRTKSAASYADVSIRTIHSWIKDGLPSSKIKGALLIRDCDLDEFITSHCCNDRQNINRIAVEVLSEMKKK